MCIDGRLLAAAHERTNLAVKIAKAEAAETKVCALLFCVYASIIELSLS